MASGSGSLIYKAHAPALQNLSNREAICVWLGEVLTCLKFWFFCCVFTISESLGLFTVSFKQTQMAYEEHKALAL